MQIGQEADDFVLGRHIVSEQPAGRAPDFRHGSFAVHHADEQVGFFRKAVKLPGGVVLEDIPVASPVDVVVELNVAAQARFYFSYTVPGLAEKGLGIIGFLLQGNHAHNFKRTQSRSLMVQMEISLPLLMLILLMPSIPGRKFPGTPSRAASTRKQLTPSKAAVTGVILPTTKENLPGRAESTSSPRCPTWT